ncbi:CLUMA_CG004179, isoform A [Clunio marinus]|uniref:CLUMA_CG004179, isoform A n=1 Tax=Clunio marinus TaxID=568069 RepID=A0A1J1HSH7_9DIPT|nr:CLUMA_CG004179, isoform A [Clunio marinus]
MFVKKIATRLRLSQKRNDKECRDENRKIITLDRVLRIFEQEEIEIRQPWEKFKVCCPKMILFMVISLTGKFIENKTEKFFLWRCKEFSSIISVDEKDKNIEEHTSEHGALIRAAGSIWFLVKAKKGRRKHSKISKKTLNGESSLQGKMNE